MNFVLPGGSARDFPDEEDFVDYVLRTDKCLYKLYKGHPNYVNTSGDVGASVEHKENQRRLLEETDEPLRLEYASDSDEDNDPVRAAQDEDDDEDEDDDDKDPCDSIVAPRRSSRAPQWSERALQQIVQAHEERAAAERGRADAKKKTELRETLKLDKEKNQTRLAYDVFHLVAEDKRDVRAMHSVLSLVKPVTVLFETSQFPTTPLIQTEITRLLRELDNLISVSKEEAETEFAQRVAKHLRTRFAVILPLVRWLTILFVLFIFCSLCSHVSSPLRPYRPGESF